MIVRVRSSPGGVDQYGDPVPGTETRDVLAGAFVAPRESADNDGRGRNGVVVGLTLYAPHGTDVKHTDDVEVDGTLFRVDGEVGSWLQPMTGWAAGVTVALTRAAG